jgi:uncharacterized protein YaeQ
MTSIAFRPLSYSNRATSVNGYSHVGVSKTIDVVVSFAQRSRRVLALGSIRRVQWATSKEEVSNLIVFDYDGPESHFAQQTQPSRARKQTLQVAIVHHMRFAFLVAYQDRKINQVCRVGRVGVEDPLQKAQSSTW